MPGKVTQSKSSWRRQQKKRQKTEITSTSPKLEQRPTTSQLSTSQTDAEADKSLLSNLDIIDQISENDPLYRQFRGVLQRFQGPSQDESSLFPSEKPRIFFDDDDIQDEEEEIETKERLSKKKRKEQSKLSIAELKALVGKPDLVEWTDTSAAEPKLHVGIKSTRNVVPIPNHWSLKREYLSSKRGVEKPAFALPKFIQDTGIAEMRDAALEKQDQASLKQKQRERVQPKMGRLDIDYQKLYEAFFHFQTKPELTRYGEIYYEGKEYETNLKHLRPGELSEELKEALSIPPGAPPPWLINQQRFGPPPSYPSLKIPGLNSPIPPGAQWGFHPGGYGKPPVDEYNRPLYGGDIFGIIQTERSQQVGEPMEKTLWGELQAPEESEEDDDDENEDEDDEDEEKGDAEEDTETVMIGSKTATNGQSVSPYRDSNDTMDLDNDNFTLRKQRRGYTDAEEPIVQKSAGTILQERNVKASGFFGSDRGYNLHSAQPGLPVLGEEHEPHRRKKNDVDIAVDVDVLENSGKLSQEDLQRKFNAKQREQHPQQWTEKNAEDQEAIASMIAEEHNKKIKKDLDRQERRGKM